MVEWNAKTAFDAVILHARCEDIDCDNCMLDEMEDETGSSCAYLANDAARFLEHWINNLPRGTTFEGLTIEDLL